MSLGLEKPLLIVELSLACALSVSNRWITSCLSFVVGQRDAIHSFHFADNVGYHSYQHRKQQVLSGKCTINSAENE